jgi:outer membrane receptor protein involved in Fe transport
LGIPNNSTRIERPLIDRNRLDSELGLFITDTFKVTSRLTLDLGIRWDHFGPASLEDGLMFNWDPATGNVVVAPDAVQSVSPLYPTDLITVVGGEVKENPSNGNFAPRLGAAFRITDRTVIRGGYGIFALTEGRYDRALEGGPFQLAETFFNSIENGRPLFQMLEVVPVVKTIFRYQ